MGLGSKLMKIAEEKANEYEKIRVTHGPGTRLYYEKLGYKIEVSPFPILHFFAGLR